MVDLPKHETWLTQAIFILACFLVFRRMSGAGAGRVELSYFVGAHVSYSIRRFKNPGVEHLTVSSQLSKSFC